MWVDKGTSLREIDKNIFDAISSEVNRQSQKLEMIASENFVSRAVLEALGSPLTNKYAEGYPGKRYYGGCEFVDIVESLAIERAKKLFGVDHANLQPHSGSQANMAAYNVVAEPGDTLLGMNLSHGGHLTHGSPVNFSGKLYNIAFYGVKKETGYIDFDDVARLAKEKKPKAIIVGASAYPRKIDFSRFRDIADDIGAVLISDIAHLAGLIIAGCHPNPAEYSQIITSTTHKTLRGPRGGLILCKKEFSAAIDKAIFPGIQGGPLMHVIAAKAVAFKECESREFVEYQKRIIENAQTLACELLNLGFNLVSGGTDNHLILIDLNNISLTGKEAEERLDKADITVNMNMIPYDTRPPRITSGIRIGTPAVTTRGMGKTEMITIARLFY